MLVILHKDAKKHYKRLPRVEQKKIQKKLLQLVKEPLAGKLLEGDLAGSRSIRAWPYRIIYRVNQNLKRVEVSVILHRQGAYK